MKEGLMPRAHEVLVYTLDKTSEGFKKVRQNYAVRVALLSAIAFPGCSIFDNQEPIPTMTPSPTSSVYQLPSSATFRSTETPTPIPTPTPESIPTPTPTIIPTATPRPIEKQKSTPTATYGPPPTPTKKTEKAPPTPKPTPTPEPTPSPTLWYKLVVGKVPEVPNTYVKPGQKLVDSYQVISNPSSVDKKRPAKVEFQGGNEQKMVKTQIKVPKTPEEIKSETEIARKKAIKEGKDPNKIVIEREKIVSVIDVPAGGAVVVHIIVDVPPGAEPGCFKDIIFSLKTAGPGTSGGEIERISLAKNVCIEETLTTYLSGLYYDDETKEGTKRVVGKMILINSAGVGQMAKLEIANCTFKIAEKEAKRDASEAPEPEKLDLNNFIPFPPNSKRTYNVYFTPEVDKKGKIPSEPWGCEPKPKRF